MLGTCKLSRNPNTTIGRQPHFPPLNSSKYLPWTGEKKACVYLGMRESSLTEWLNQPDGTPSQCSCGCTRINILVDSCPSCGNVRCAWCKTTKVQVRWMLRSWTCVSGRNWVKNGHDVGSYHMLRKFAGSQIWTCKKSMKDQTWWVYENVL